MNRRAFMLKTTAATTAAIVAASTFPRGTCGAATASAPPPLFPQRGYYLCFMRMPTFGLSVWRDILDGAAEDGANTIILWIAGAFRSKKFPITWQWAKEHRNVQADFARRLIAHAHRR